MLDMADPRTAFRSEELFDTLRPDASFVSKARLDAAPGLLLGRRADNRRRTTIIGAATVAWCSEDR